MAQLEIIGELRDAQKLIIEEEKNMPPTYNIEKDIRYNQGLEQGLEKVHRDFVISLLQNTHYSVEEIAKLVSVSPEFVTAVKSSLKDGGVRE